MSLARALHADVRRRLGLVVLFAAVAGAPASPASAQDVMSRDAAAAVKAAFLADLDGMRAKFVGLAQAFPADKYTWRPMEGVRSVSEVLMLLATEGQTFAPNGFGAKPGLSREEGQKLSAITDKAQVIEHLNKGFDYAKQAIEAVDPATLTGRRAMFGRERSVAEIAQLVGGDMHEHLGQLIAYARMNRIVPPWSK